jgi:DNA ligase-associated metallophosphoesterase
VEIELGGERLRLLAQGGVLLPDHGAILVADLHLGKGAAFRAAGRPVPAGTSRQTLTRLTALVEAAPAAERLWILGDLFHHPSGTTGGLDRGWRRWRADHPRLDTLLVEGNHDRRLKEVARRWGLDVRRAPVPLGGLELHHEPPLAGPEVGPGVAGHLHPVVRLREGRRSRLRLPCFWLRREILVLPALGSLVDGAGIQVGPGERIFVPAGDQVLEIPSAQLPSSARAG